MEHTEIIYRCIQPVTLLDAPRFSSIYGLLLSCRSLRGDIAEIGVYRGGASLGMALTVPEKRIHLFDTFEGLPEPTFPEHHQKGDFGDTSVEEVRGIFSSHHNTIIHQGRFPESVRLEGESLQFCFVHVDGAFYETTRDAIDFCFPRLVPGGVMVFDDWEWPACPGVKQALLERQRTFGFDICLRAPCQAFIRKPLDREDL